MTITTARAGTELLYEAKCDRCAHLMLVTPSRRTLLDMLGIYTPGWQAGEPIVCTTCCEQRVDDTWKSGEYHNWTGGRSRRHRDAKQALRRARKAERAVAKYVSGRENGSKSHE